MKKRLILFMLLPAISLTANTDAFYERVYALQKHKESSFSTYSRRAVVQNSPRRVYRHGKSRVEKKNRMRTRPIVRRVNSARKIRAKVNMSAGDTRNFFYATRAANNGNAKAQFDLAIMYANGRGTQKNEKLAFNWFHKSARNNYAPAKHYMGISFLQGRGVRKQKELARYWFKLAIQQGYKNSLNYLSQLNQSLANRG